jgi:hypothetical protein
MQYEENKAPESYELVILRCSPLFTASLEGWATGASGHPSRRAQKRAPQDDAVPNKKSLGRNRGPDFDASSLRSSQ